MPVTDEVPTKFDLKKVKVNPVSDAPAKFDLGKVKLNPLGEKDFIVEGEGTYQMTGKDGKAIPVSYSQIQAASQAGYTMHPNDRVKYVKDAAADPNLKGLSPASGVSIVGRNSAGQPILAPQEDKPEGSALGRFASSFGSAITGAAKGLYHGIADEPRTPEEVGIVNGFGDPVQGRAALIAWRLGISPQIEQGKQAASEFKQANPFSLHPTQEQLWHRQKALSHAGATLIPGLGPWANQVGEQAGKQWGTGDTAGGWGTIGGNVALYEAPHLIGKGAGLIARTPRATLEAVTNTSPREIREMAEQVQQKNADAIKDAADKDKIAQGEFDTKKKNAEHETKGLEIGHEFDVRQKAQELATKHQADVAETEAHNQRVWDKTTKKYKQESEGVRADNQRIIDKYNEEKSRIEDENKAAENMLEMRRAEENALNRDTVDYYAKEDEVKAQTKDSENKAWEPWHKKMDDVPVDVQPIEQQLEPILKVSPEATRAINQLVPDPSDVDPASDYAKERARVMKSSGYGDKPEDYWKLDAKRRLDIDKMTASSGFEPEPIDLKPDAAGKIPLKVIQRAQSIIGRNIAKGKYEGYLEGEMKKVQSILRGVVTKTSVDHGTDALLDSARDATRKYQEAFGKERPALKTLDELRQKGANPEEYKEQQDEERLAGAKNISPELVESYRAVKARRDALKAMKTEDQLRKSIQQVPAPPTVGDLRSGYNLKQFPVYEPPTIDDLREGYRLKPRPALPVSGAAAQAVKEPNRVSPGPEPPPIVPDTQTISPEDIEKNKIENIKKQANELRRTGSRRALYSMLTGLGIGIPFAISDLFQGNIASGLGKDVIGGVGAGALVFAGSHAIANLIERADVKAWISNITPRDVAQWEKLPPEQKALFTEDMSKLESAAEAKGIKVSPALKAFVVGSMASQPQPLNEVKQEGEKRQKETHVEHEDARAELPPELVRIKKSLGARLVQAKPYENAVASVDQGEPNIIQINDPKRFAQAPAQTEAHELVHLFFNQLAGPIRKAIPPDNARFPYDISHVDELRKKGYKLWNLPQEVAATVVQRWVARPEERQRLQPWIEDFNEAPLSVEEPTSPSTPTKAGIVMSIRPPLPPPETNVSPQDVRAKAEQLQSMFKRAGMAR